MYLGVVENEEIIKQLLKDYMNMSIKDIMNKYSLKKHEVVKITTKNNVYKRCDYWSNEEIELASKGIIPKGRTKKSMESFRQKHNLGTIGGRKRWTKNEESYLIHNWKNKTDYEISIYLNRFEGSVKNKRIKLGLINEFKWSDIDKDILLDCSTLSEAIDRLPNRSVHAIKHMIKKLNIKFKNKRFTFPHQIVCKQIMKLGLTYINEYKIDKYHIDCYLPSIKLCIEINGSYWHSLNNRKKLDSEKIKYLKNNRYNILTITEDDTKNIDVVINKITKKVVNCWETQTYNDVGNQQPRP